MSSAVMDVHPQARVGQGSNFGFRSFGPPHLGLLLMAVQGYLNIHG